MFSPSVYNSIVQDKMLIAHRWAAYQNYLAKVDAIRGFKEEVYQDGFFKEVFEACLGYTLNTTNPSSYTLEREKKNETDSKKADGVIILDGQVVGVIELKDQRSKNLDAVEAQAFSYHTSHSHSKYIIISNFDELRFYIDKKPHLRSFAFFIFRMPSLRSSIYFLATRVYAMRYPCDSKRNQPILRHKSQKHSTKIFQPFGRICLKTSSTITPT